MKAIELLKTTSEQQEVVVEWHNGDELKSARITGGFKKWLFQKHDQKEVNAVNSEVRMITVNDDGSLNVLVRYDQGE